MSEGEVVEGAIITSPALLMIGAAWRGSDGAGSADDPHDLPLIGNYGLGSGPAPSAVQTESRPAPIETA